MPRSTEKNKYIFTNLYAFYMLLYKLSFISSLTFYNTNAQEHGKMHTFYDTDVQEHVKADTFYNTDAQEQAAGSIWLNEFMQKGLG